MELTANPGTSLLIDALDKRWGSYRVELKRCKKEPNEEAIHDLRVATRRLLALVDMLRALDPRSRLRKLRSDLKDQLDSLADLRDTQVMLVEVSARLADLPELAPFQNYLIKREKRLLRSTVKAIQAFHSVNVRKRLVSARNALFKIKDENDHKSVLLLVVDRAYKTTLQRYRKIEPAKPATIHRVRVAFKKFRYMVELIHPLIPTFPSGNFKQMQDYQSLMGDIQDMEVLLSVFDKFTGKDSSYEPDTVRQHYQQRHSEKVGAFVKDMHLLDLFWRPAPGAPFPWEIGPGKSVTPEGTTGPIPAQAKDGKTKPVEVEQEAKE